MVIEERRKPLLSLFWEFKEMLFDMKMLEESYIQYFTRML